MTPTTDAFRLEQLLDYRIGQRLIQARELLDLSQEDVAAEIGISVDQLDGHETGIDPVTASRLVRLSEALRIRPEMLVTGLLPHG